MKKRTTAQALFLSVISLMLCVSMLIGTTFAWFTDSVSSARNTIQSGNLDVELEYLDANGDWKPVTSGTDVFGYDLWEPGYTKVTYFKVTNKGTLALNYQLHADVYEETAGENKDDEEFLLSDYLKVAVVPEGIGRNDILAENGIVSARLKDTFMMKQASLNAGDNSGVIGLAIWMPTTVGNEANHNGEAPEITFGINLVATQKTYEEDTFNDQYDVDATLPYVATGATTVDPTDAGASYEVVAYKLSSGSPVGSATVTAASLAADATKLELNIEKAEDVYSENGFTVAADQNAVTYDVTVTGVKEGNTTPIKVSIKVAPGLTGVKLYHYGTEVAPITYNATTGYVSFETIDFSPFTVTYDAEPEEDDSEEPSESDLPVAIVTPYNDIANIEWGNFGGWSPDYEVDENPMLEAAYTFACEETVEEALANPYADWYCDFYVSLDRDLGENEIFLGGHYGDFGWVGFHNGDVTLAANEELPLLGSVTQNPWTYADIANFVGEFICGVGDVDDALAGATFTVDLRLTNPADETEFYNVATIEYTFTGTVGNNAYVDNGEDLQDAVNDGVENITLTGDIDLSQGLVIPGNN